MNSGQTQMAMEASATTQTDEYFNTDPTLTLYILYFVFCQKLTYCYLYPQIKKASYRSISNLNVCNLLEQLKGKLFQHCKNFVSMPLFYWEKKSLTF